MTENRIRIPDVKYRVGALFAFLVIYSLIFLQVPLAGKVSGNSGAWYLMALGRLRVDLLLMHLGGTPTGTPLYPAEHLFMYGASTPLMMYGYGFLSKIVGNDIWAFFLTIVLITSTSAYAVFRLAHYLTNSVVAGLFAGFLFGCNTFWFANTDDSVIGSYFLTVMALVWTETYFDNRQKRFLYLAAVLGALQIYVFSYTYLFQTLVFSIVVAARWMRAKRREDIAVIFKSALIYILVAAPMVVSHLYAIFVVAPVNPYQTANVVQQCSLSLTDLWRPISGNLIYTEPAWTAEAAVDWCLMRRHSLTGVVFTLLAVSGLAVSGKQLARYALILLSGALIAFGPEIKLWSDVSIPSPINLLYDFLPLFEFVRVPLRAHLLLLLAGSLFSAAAVATMQKKLKNVPAAAAVIALAAIAHTVEHVPDTMPAWEAAAFIEPHPELIALANSNPQSILIHLPSDLGLGTRNAREDLYAYNREIIYMYLQSHHKMSIVNGVHGYFPRERLITAQHMSRLPDEQVARWFSEKIGVTHIVYHRDLELKDEPSRLIQLENADYLSKVFEDENLVIFQIKFDTKSPTLP